MIFKPELAHQVLIGRKTQTRRPIKEGEQTCRYRRGRTYAVQSKRGGKSMGRIKVLAVERQRLEEITAQDAHAEGFKHRIAFFRYWEKLYGSVDYQQKVWAIAFVAVEEGLFLGPASRPGYVTDPLMAPRADQATEPEHVRRREPEPQVVPPVVQEQFSREAGRRDAERKREVWEQERRHLLGSMERLGSEMGLEVRRELRVIERRLAAIDRKLERAA